MTIRTFDTGAVRDADADSLRFDLIPTESLERLAATYAEGAEKYSAHNWRKGMPFSNVLNHVLVHLYKWQKRYKDEDHLAHAAWGLFSLMAYEDSGRADLDDRWHDGLLSVE